MNYAPQRVCALKGSSVDLSCTYKHPEGLTVTRSLWFIESWWTSGAEPVDVRQYEQYKGRVQYSLTLNSCRMTITNLTESDAHTYRFRFYTDDPEGRYAGRRGVSLSITDLKVTVSDTDGGDKKLTCSSTCTLPNNPTYIWYKNRQPVSDQNRNELELRDRTVDAGSYSCAVKGYEELGSPAVCVFDKVLQVKVEGPAGTVSEGQTVTLTCTSTCTLPNDPTYICPAAPQYRYQGFSICSFWRRRGFTSDIHCRLFVDEGASAPVYDEVSTLAVTSEASRAASSDGQDDVQYSSVHFSRSQTKDVPLSSTVHPSHALREEEEVQYAAVNTARPGAAQ
ncbi:hypothetical protein MHYP_G00061830 [Metynnis hypsauchen]